MAGSLHTHVVIGMSVLTFSSQTATSSTYKNIKILRTKVTCKKQRKQFSGDVRKHSAGKSHDCQLIGPLNTFHALFEFYCDKISNRKQYSWSLLLKFVFQNKQYIFLSKVTWW